MVLPSTRTFNYWSDAGELIPTISMLDSSTIDYWGDTGELTISLSGSTLVVTNIPLEVGRINDIVSFTHGHILDR